MHIITGKLHAVKEHLKDPLSAAKEQK